MIEQISAKEGFTTKDLARRSPTEKKNGRKERKGRKKYQALQDD